MKKELFNLGHVALYAKGWYHRSLDVVADMKQAKAMFEKYNVLV